MEPDCDMNFAGFESSAKRLMQRTYLSFGELVNLSASYESAIFSYISRNLHSALDHLINRRKVPITGINLCGGVACNNALFNNISKLEKLYPDIRVVRSEP